MELLFFLDGQEESLDLCVGLSLARVKVGAPIKHVEHADIFVYPKLSEAALRDFVKYGCNYKNLNDVENRENQQPHRT